MREKTPAGGSHLGMCIVYNQRTHTSHNDNDHRTWTTTRTLNTAMPHDTLIGHAKLSYADSLDECTLVLGYNQPRPNPICRVSKQLLYSWPTAPQDQMPEKQRSSYENLLQPAPPSRGAEVEQVTNGWTARRVLRRANQAGLVMQG